MPNEVMRERYYSNIRSKLSFLVTEIRLDNSVNLQTLNIHAENIFAGVLNTLYGWSLKNANAVKQNATGIDLYDEKNKIVVQVSSKHTHKKIQEESIDKIIKQTISDGDPTPRYKGYHYYFLAIAEIARPTKDFTVPSWLAFDQKKDILDLTKLLSVALDSSPEKQEELSELLDREMSSETATQRMKTVAEIIPLSQRNPFRYDAETVPFIGRKKEMDLLRNFLNGETAFKWWAIVGPGGSGKTRLAYELKKELDEEGEWTTAFIGENFYDELDSLDNEKLNKQYPRKTLFIADHVQQNTSVLGRWMNRMSSEDFRRDNPIRLLLLERDTGFIRGQYAWEAQILNAARNARHIIDKREDEILSLQPLDFWKNSDLLAEMIVSFAESLRTREPKLPIINIRIVKTLAKQIKLDPALQRPLFVLFLTDAYLHTQKTDIFETNKLLAYSSNRELDLLKGAIMNLRPNESLNEQLYSACCFIWKVATATGISSDKSAERIAELCKEHWEVVRKNADEYKLTSPEELLRRVGLYEKGTITALRPDLLGEYFVLSWLISPDKEYSEISCFFSTILKEEICANVFIQRLFRDFLPVLKKDSLDFLRPENLNLNVEQHRKLSDCLSKISLGGKEEIDRLKEFILDDRSFCWWMISGVAGSGKSHLASLLSLELQATGDWEIIQLYRIEPDYLFSRNNVVQEVFLKNQSKNILFVVDLVNLDNDIDVLEKLVRELCSWRSPLLFEERKRRIILLYRPSVIERSESKQFLWEKFLEHHTDTRFDEPLRLVDGITVNDIFFLRRLRIITMPILNRRNDFTVGEMLLKELDAILLNNDPVNPYTAAMIANLLARIPQYDPFPKDSHSAENDTTGSTHHEQNSH